MNNNGNISSILEETFGISLSAGHELRTMREPATEDIETRVINDDCVLVGYLICDSDTKWEEHGENGTVYDSFRSVDALAEKQRELKAEGKIFFPVSYYQHGLRHYSIAGTGRYPDSQWDVSHASCLFVPPDDLQDEYRARVAQGEAESAAEDLEKACNQLLDDYSHWFNGSVYSIVVEWWERAGADGDDCERTRDEMSWFSLGLTAAEKELEFLLDSEAGASATADTSNQAAASP